MNNEDQQALTGLALELSGQVFALTNACSTLIASSPNRKLVTDLLDNDLKNAKKDSSTNPAYLKGITKVIDHIQAAAKYAESAEKLSDSGQSLGHGDMN